MSEFDLRSLLGALHERDVAFVVIGGVAVAAHGSIRGTGESLDIVPDPDSGNLGRLSEALDKLKSTLPTAENRPFSPETDFGVIRQGGNVTAMTMFGGLDVVQRAQGVPSFSQLADDAVESELLGIPVRICSLARLREMKQA